MNQFIVLKKIDKDVNNNDMNAGTYEDLARSQGYSFIPVKIQDDRCDSVYDHIDGMIYTINEYIESCTHVAILTDDDTTGINNDKNDRLIYGLFLTNGLHLKRIVPISEELLDMYVEYFNGGEIPFITNNGDRAKRILFTWALSHDKTEMGLSLFHKMDQPENIHRLYKSDDVVKYLRFIFDNNLIDSFEKTIHLISLVLSSKDIEITKIASSHIPNFYSYGKVINYKLNNFGFLSENYDYVKNYEYVKFILSNLSTKEQSRFFRNFISFGYSDLLKYLLDSDDIDWTNIITDSIIKKSLNHVSTTKIILDYVTRNCKYDKDRMNEIINYGIKHHKYKALMYIIEKTKDPYWSESFEKIFTKLAKSMNGRKLHHASKKDTCTVKYNDTEVQICMTTEMKILNLVWEKCSKVFKDEYTVSYSYICEKDNANVFLFYLQNNIMGRPFKFHDAVYIISTAIKQKSFNIIKAVQYLYGNENTVALIINSLEKIDDDTLRYLKRISSEIYGRNVYESGTTSNIWTLNYE